MKATLITRDHLEVTIELPAGDQPPTEICRYLGTHIHQAEPSAPHRRYELTSYNPLTYHEVE